MKVQAMPDFKEDVICYRDAEGIYTNIPLRITKHSPDGFGWGYGGSGPSDFALNILSVFIGQEVAECGGLYQDFKFQFIAALPKEGGTIKREDILKWVEQKTSRKDECTK